MKVLIAFGAKVNVLNRANLTPLDHVQGPQRFYYHTEDLKDFLVLTPEKRSFPLTAIPPPPNEECTESEGVDSPDDQAEVALSPTAFSPPTKRIRIQFEGVDSSTVQVQEAPPDVVPRGPASDTEQLQSLSPSVQQMHLSVPLQGKLRRQRSMSWSSLTVPPQAAEQPPPSTAQLETDGPVEVTVGSVHVDQATVEGIADTLKSAGGKRSKNLSRVDTMARVPRFKSFIDEKEPSSKGQWSSSTLPWYYSRLENTIEQRLANVSVPLMNTPDEAIALAVQMRELRMYQKAGSRILFLDGGGMRGLLQIEILSQVTMCVCVCVCVCVHVRDQEEGFAYIATMIT